MTKSGNFYRTLHLNTSMLISSTVACYAYISMLISSSKFQKKSIIDNTVETGRIAGQNCQGSYATSDFLGL